MKRVVSLVPSLTEAIATTAPELLIGATDWCTHPPELDIERIRGTKNPDIPRIIDLQPDLVVANEEENRAADLTALQEAGLTVWITQIRTLDEAFPALASLLTEGCGLAQPAWLDRAEAAWAALPSVPPEAAVPAIVPIWRRPWMVLGRDTFAGDVLARLGVRNVYADHPERYPKVPLPELLGSGAELVVLPDEPYAFSAGDGPEAFPGLPSVLLSGRHLTWYGPSLTEAAGVLRRQLFPTA